jgi:hypothetical protein
MALYTFLNTLCYDPHGRPDHMVVPRHLVDSTRGLVAALLNELNLPDDVHLPDKVFFAVGLVFERFRSVMDGKNRLRVRDNSWAYTIGDAYHDKTPTPACGVYVVMNKFAPHAMRATDATNPLQPRWTTALNRVWRSVVHINHAKLNRAITMECVRTRVLAHAALVLEDQMCVYDKRVARRESKRMADSFERAIQLVLASPDHVGKRHMHIMEVCDRHCDRHTRTVPLSSL